MHGKTSKIISKSWYFKKSSKNFEATRYHNLIIEKRSLSKDLEITAETRWSYNGIKHKKYNVHGVQFHLKVLKLN